MANWPTPQDYNEAVQNPASAFDEAELKSGAPELTSLGLPRVTTGAFASVYRLRCGEKDWAVRCFLREVHDQQQRYAVLSNYLCNDDLSYTVHFEYLPKGIKVQGSWFPILKMEWVQGDTLDLYIRKHRFIQENMQNLLNQFDMMLYDLREAGIAHGDLQHGNIVVAADGIRLVDYDGMFVPGLTGWQASELGHRNYQHPERGDKDFGPSLDNFSSRVIRSSIACLIEDADLWTRTLGGEECLLFRQIDYLKPLSSHTFHMLERHKAEVVRSAASQLRGSLLSAPLDVPFIDMMVAPPIDLPLFETVLEAEANERANINLVPQSVEMLQPVVRTWKPVQQEPGTADGYCNQGNVQLTTGNFSQAIRYFQKALHLNFDCQAAFYGLGLANVARREYALAHSNFSAAIRLDSNNAEAYAGRGVALSGSEQYVRAMADFNKALSINAKCSRALVGRGLAQLHLRQFAAATIDVEQAIRINPCAFTYCGHGQVYQAIGKTEDALNDFETALRMDPNFADAYYHRGLIRISEDNYDAAIEDLQLCLKNAPESSEAWCAIGDIYHRTGQFQKAMESFEKAIEVDDRQPEKSWVGIGNALFELGDFRRAGKYFDQAFERTQGYLPGLDSRRLSLARGFALLDKGEPESALLQFMISTGSNEPLLEAFVGQGICYFRLGRTAEALDAFNKVVPSPNIRSMLRGWRALCHVYLADIEAAEEEFSQSKAEGEQLAAPLSCALGYLALRQNNYSRATQAFEDALEADEHLHEAERGLRLTQGYMLLSKSKFKESHRLFDDLFKSKRSDAFSIRGRALAALGMKRHRDAEFDLAEANYLQPNSIETRAAQAQLLAFRKQYDQALSSLGELIEEKPEEAILYTTRASIYEMVKRKREASEDRKRAEILLSLKQEYPHGV